ncbi:MAG: AAA family ATPase [Caldilineaceae bacterium]
MPSPRELVAHLDEYPRHRPGPGQRVLSVAVYNHYKRVFKGTRAARRSPASVTAETPDEDEIELTKSNVLLIGSTGSGRTLLAQTMARYLSVRSPLPTPPSPRPVTWVKTWRRSGRAAPGRRWDPERAAYGIVYIDEIDKIAPRAATTRASPQDVSWRGRAAGAAQDYRGDGGQCAAAVQGANIRSRVHRLNTANVLFICGSVCASGRSSCASVSSSAPALALSVGTNSPPACS